MRRRDRGEELLKCGCSFVDVVSECGHWRDGPIPRSMRTWTDFERGDLEAASAQRCEQAYRERSLTNATVGACYHDHLHHRCQSARAASAAIAARGTPAPLLSTASRLAPSPPAGVTAHSRYGCAKFLFYRSARRTGVGKAWDDDWIISRSALFYMHVNRSLVV